MEERRIEGLWDCVYCGQTAIKARHAECPFCGKPRGVETIFYLPDDLESATLTAEECAKTTDRADWLCEYCGSYNKSNVLRCERCGSEKDQSSVNYGILHKLTGKLFHKKN